jgi:hypothetical protein
MVFRFKMEGYLAGNLNDPKPKQHGDDIDIQALYVLVDQVLSDWYLTPAIPHPGTLSTSSTRSPLFLTQKSEIPPYAIANHENMPFEFPRWFLKARRSPRQWCYRSYGSSDLHVVFDYKIYFHKYVNNI